MRSSFVNFTTKPRFSMVGNPRTQDDTVRDLELLGQKLVGVSGVEEEDTVGAAAV
jgi:hypothetical protein|tara:strand:+ start:4260 stop:4424 length:165 start_codon:yes stop_codon:yes gene_type:complete